MKLKKGSAEAKRYMAKIRSMKAGSKKKPTKKVGLGATKYIEKGESAKTKPKRIITITRFPKAKLQTKKNSGKPGTFKSFAGVHKDTKSHNVRINVVSGVNNSVLDDIKAFEFKRNKAIEKEIFFINHAKKFKPTTIENKLNKKYSLEYKNLIKYYTLQINKLKKLIK